MLNKNKYLLSFTTGGLYHQQSVLIAEMYLIDSDWNEVYKKAVDHNVLQSRTQSTSKRVAIEIINRLKKLSDEELKFFTNTSPLEQKQILFISICRRYQLIYDFSKEILRERYLTLKYDLPVEEFDSFYNHKEQWHAELEKISPSSRSKLRSVLYKILTDAEILDKNKIIFPVMLSIDLIKLIAKENIDDLFVFPISDSDIKRGLQ